MITERVKKIRDRLGSQGVTRDRLLGPLFLMALLVLSLTARYSLLPFASRDYTNFLEPWYDFIMANGRIQSFRFDFANYSPPYLYLLSASTFLPFSKIVSIKLISIFFDFTLAGVMYMIVRLKYRALVAWGAFLVTIFAPTVLLNSAMWGQCDAILGTFILLSVYCLMTGRSFWAVLAFSVALSFKLQAIFFLPVLFIFWLKRKVSLVTFLLVPATIFVSFLPSMLVGRPFDELASVYLNQAELYNRLYAGAPNLYRWFTNDYFDYFYLTGLSVTAALFLALSYAVYRNKAAMTPDIIIRLSLLSVLVAAYFLPKMHERYFYLADITAIAYGFYVPRKFYVPIVIGLISMFTYILYFFHIIVMDLNLLAVVLGGIILVILVDLVRALGAAADSDEPPPIAEIAGD